jgi:colicin import membrane protein
MRGLTGSALLHGGLLAWALVSFHETKPFKLPEPEPVEVAIVSEGDIVRLRQGDRQSKLLEAQPQVKPSPEPQPQEAPRPKPPPFARPSPSSPPSPMRPRCWTLCWRSCAVLE